jgi:hypothetical protein
MPDHQLDNVYIKFLDTILSHYSITTESRFYVHIIKRIIADYNISKIKIYDLNYNTLKEYADLMNLNVTNLNEKELIDLILTELSININ